MSAADNVMSAPYGGCRGDISGDITMISDIPPCHKVACEDIASGGSVVKYGCAIGVASQAIKKGEWVHDHNMHSAGRGTKPAACEWKGPYIYDMRAPRVFAGFRRRGARPGIRNDLWVIPTARSVGNKLKQFIANYHKPYWIDDVRLLDYPSFRAGADLDETLDILLGLSRAPNTAGVLFAGADGENMPMTDICHRALSEGGRVACTVLRENTANIAASCLDDLAAASPRRREEFPVSELCVGIRGAAGGYSGLSANPLLGRFAERMASQGTAVLTPAGAYMADIREAISKRITSHAAYDKFAAAASAYPPTAPPDEWENGATTQKERALASCPITGKSPVTAFLGYGETAARTGGVQIVPNAGELASDCVIFAAAGAQLILVATERMTPFGGAVPTAQISSSDEKANRHPEYADFSAGTILMGESLDDAAKRLEDYAISVACGEKVSHDMRVIRGVAG
jgi:altronate hydrolase